ncbi:1-(5-phosphoribosyl)-5-[(5-phosphoribosylamino)methylideneamino]imidazole-4-carboxamide isomerase [Oceanobacillus iheyensis]|uniref:1-(5-phosphoribosyl)-5-[(5-phosphoribosylamino)methylideneamino] imidazole-4-carboxamide isomerase n=1 Tax=Oceanobacillus iheyensis (strain DSM 14371 / CIP 107618 / JCM 11309 / KCTC 3954 / HTE831) TaxID=221109 RepID=HIS4_OCEIH|nr:1-(5-phosphoribosyl)-5-[(5-phosphoribosylamino)methylideneamino]imidazole-4-carboxamide isomerase [Oceanobacillus iheyensis]Q8ESS1.1 RecName: Full=1-(5-phosphoribosyl)-5-[(5-phosphoribosylamino)methylideneamino] imidazole-4-carboxamide isomerase; AltName: Full=Phosphoribosylformimino-5-aminoimidazole carboxamide ribotide isomerase [Oceanobacillus iheyensis HTE831]BAC12504.1 phosphoribosyl formimino-5-aminoimidazole isomerase [Oceanobacillus iheyensis HTE831]
MIIFPAIDIRNGKCVRLRQGDYNQETIYSNSPVEMAKEWEASGAEYLHTVDLDGAKSGESNNINIIQDVAQALSIPIQVGGGIRSLEVIDKYIQAGVSRVILGTAAITDSVFLQTAVESYAEKIAVSIDARNGFIATDGWTKNSTVEAIPFIKQLESIGVKTIIYTDILKDGMMSGPNFQELDAVQQATTMNIIASGGVTTEKDVQQLKTMNLYGAIIGKALYDGSIKLQDILEGEMDAR